MDRRVSLEITPAFMLVDYAWAVLTTNLPNIWNADNYEGIVPIVPLTEEPELDKYKHPRIVYGWAEEASSIAQPSGSITFAVADENFRRLTKTLNVLKLAFEREDESARDINNFTSNFMNGEYLGVTFAWTAIGYVEGGAPEQTEGGRQSGAINVRYEYHADFDIVTKV